MQKRVFLMKMKNVDLNLVIKSEINAITLENLEELFIVFAI